jgi:hypothetical protein
MGRRILLITAMVLAAGSFALAPSASAQDYGGCQATVSDDTPDPGQVITVTGSGAANDGPVSASLDGTEVGSGTATGTGTFSFSATIPASASGTETLSINCFDGGQVLGITLTVNQPAPTTTTTAGPTTTVAPTTTTTAAVAAAGLPRTGSSSTLPMTTVALALVVLGSGVLATLRLRARAGRASL